MFVTLGDPLMFCYVFYATLLYGIYPLERRSQFLHEVPDGVYVYMPWDKDVCWYLKDLTPVLIEDVPKELRALVLLMGI